MFPSYRFTEHSVLSYSFVTFRSKELTWAVCSWTGSESVMKIMINRFPFLHVNMIMCPCAGVRRNCHFTCSLLLNCELVGVSSWTESESVVKITSSFPFCWCKIMYVLINVANAILLCRNVSLWTCFLFFVLDMWICILFPLLDSSHLIIIIITIIIVTIIIIIIIIIIKL